MIADRLSLIGLLFLFFISWTRASSHIQDAQCALMEAQIHLAYMGTLLNSTVYEKNTLEASSNQNALVSQIVDGLIETGKTDNTKAIDKDFIEFYKEMKTASCSGLTAAANIATQMAKYIGVALPFPFNVNSTNYTKLSDNNLEADLKTAIEKLLPS